MHGRNVVKRTTSAIPDGQDQVITTSRRQSYSAKHEAHSILGVSLPSKEIIDDLLEEYFDSVHWFSLVIYEPTFRRQYDSVADGYAYQSQKGFLILVATVLGIASWYRAETSAPNSNEDWDGWRVRLFAVAETRFLELMDERSLASLQTCLLLGTYHVYHGRPNASLALLGATIKIAQAMGLHRESVRGGSDESEERKRIWWTIYTWDRWEHFFHTFRLQQLSLFNVDLHLLRTEDPWGSTTLIVMSLCRQTLMSGHALRPQINRVSLYASRPIRAS